MSIVVIGDRRTGKTSMVRALAEHGKYVKISNILASDLYNPSTKEIAGTDMVNLRTLNMEVDLPATGPRQLNILWIDTPGEFWSSPQYRKDYPAAWQGMEDKVKESKAVILMLPPHQSLVSSTRINMAANHLYPFETLPTTDQWVNGLQNWFDFLKQNCQRVKHIIIALHKADLFCDVEAEGKTWKYNPKRGGAAPWYDYSDHVVESYFGVANQVIRKYKGTEIGSRTNFFITTTENQELLELPWLYLAPYLIYN
ncbi:GTPase domain-containing protein [Aphanizomenon flos-aquae]|uniref:GTPase domain-containing protein n=1 Tax=Aphanizomenon flos-aquae FACHB-1040 TaxID=2692887 RepID=A0ABR8C1D2_APHFL|nr:GTPase domain-containing protein [Aphanizomenon flos-aquae]MBD2280451.1 GTPase domain-containing protein [Aphanizomenon flos-aquae FACHB-1040]